MGDRVWDFSLPLHLQINPPKKPSLKSKLAMNPNIRQIFVRQGLRLSGRELKSLMAGRSMGISTIAGILAKTSVTRDLSPGARLELATGLADVLMERSLEAQLSREAPTALDRINQQNEQLQHVLMGSVVRDFPVQAKITIHLPVEWL